MNASIGVIWLGIVHWPLGIDVVMPTRTQQLGLIIVLAVLVLYVFVRVL